MKYGIFTCICEYNYVTTWKTHTCIIKTKSFFGSFRIQKNLTIFMFNLNKNILYFNIKVFRKDLIFNYIILILTNKNEET